MNTTAADDFQIDTYRDCDQSGMIALWQACELIVPWNNPGTDIARKTGDSPDLFFTGRVGELLIASCMAGYDGHRGWIYFMAVHPDFRRRGYAAQLVSHTEARLIELGCPKLELMVRKSNQSIIAFYQAIGFDLDPVVVLSKRLQQDEAHDFV